MRPSPARAFSLLFVLAFSIFGCQDNRGEAEKSVASSGAVAVDDRSFEPTSFMPIADFLKEKVADVPADKMDAMMRGHYRRLRLLDDAGGWTLPRLATASTSLLPDDIGVDRSFQLIDEAAKAAQKNPYLVNFVHEALGENFADYMAHVNAQGAEVFPDVIAYAHVLERLTVVMRDDWRILEDCMNHWKAERENAGISEHLDWFEHAKLASVEWPMGKFVEAQRVGHVPSDFMRIVLPMNIMEAVLVDAFDGMFDNATAGLALASYAPGADEHDEATGEGPSCFSEDGKAILLNMALPKQWADLYAVWNLAFVTGYAHPYIMVKLLIPSVNDYEDAPAEYIYNRGMALYTHIHFEAFRRIDFIKAGTHEICWPDEHLREFFGRLSKKYARHYDGEVRKIKYPWL